MGIQTLLIGDQSIHQITISPSFSQKRVLQLSVFRRGGFSLSEKDSDNDQGQGIMCYGVGHIIPLSQDYVALEARLECSRIHICSMFLGQFEEQVGRIRGKGNKVST